MIKSRICIRVIFYIMCEHKRQMSPQFEERTSKNFQRFRRPQWNIVEPIKQRHFYAAKWSDASEKQLLSKLVFHFLTCPNLNCLMKRWRKKPVQSFCHDQRTLMPHLLPNTCCQILAGRIFKNSFVVFSLFIIHVQTNYPSRSEEVEIL